MGQDEAADIRCDEHGNRARRALGAGEQGTSFDNDLVGVVGGGDDSAHGAGDRAHRRTGGGQGTRDVERVLAGGGTLDKDLNGSPGEEARPVLPVPSECFDSCRGPHARVDSLPRRAADQAVGSAVHMSQTDILAPPIPAVEESGRPILSVVVTLLNEENTVEELYRRTVEAIDRLSVPFELIFVDDGSSDATFARLERLHAADGRVRAVRFKRNFGQHPAMHAGLVRARGEYLLTMDGDLQNAPEDIPKLYEAVAAGADVASGRRLARRDSWGRTLPSRLINGMLRRFTGVAIADFGCAFNAYRRSAVEPMLGSIGRQKFTKALVLSGGASVVEVDVSHASRLGPSRYSPLRLTQLALHVLAGFWPQPIQWIGVFLGIVCTLLAVALGAYGIFFWVDRSNFPGPLLGGVAVLFVLGIQGFILALVGEYLGRIQRGVENRPLYTIDRELG
jgi:undecaprenyl-phosphate 4-deoxy-4-formamido-L-arabinose transferase